MARAEIVNSAVLRIESANAAFDDVLHVNKIAFLLAVLENSRPLTGLHLPRQMIDHAGGHALVCFSRSINVEVTQANADPVRELGGSFPRDIIPVHIGEGVNVGWRGAI